MISRLTIRVIRLMLLAGALASMAYAQGVGINVALRANADPFPGNDRYANVWGNGNFAYVGSYLSNGVLIFDITNPDAPVLAANYIYSVDQPICGTSCDNSLEDVEVQNGIGFFASNHLGGIHIVDLSNPYKPQLITRITSAIGGWDSVHTILVSGDYMYVPHFLVDPYMQVWNISNPAAPVLMWTFLTTDPDSIRQSSILGNRLYTSGRGGHTDIWDVTNIATEPPVLLGTIMSGTLSHSSSPTPDGNYLVGSRELNANGGDVRIYNVSNPASPSQVSIITMPAYGIESVSPHNPAVVGNLLYHSWYDAGIFVFDITDPTNPIMVGNYDTWPGPVTVSQYDGDWGIYPYLGQNEILASDQNTGLYILDATGVNSNPVLFNYLVNPPPATSSQPVTGASPSVTGSVAAKGTAYLLGVAPTGGATISISSSGPATTSSTITIPAGQHSATASISTTPVTTTTPATFTATYNTGTVTGGLNVLPPALSTTTVSPASVIGGNNLQGQVTLNAATAAATTVALNIVSGGAAIASMPSSVTIAAGANSATWQITTNAVSTTTPVTISATLGSTTLKASFTVAPSVPISVTFAPSSVTGGGTSTGQVTFPGPVTADTTVTLIVLSGGAAVASIPPTVTVSANNSSVTFPVVAAAVTTTTTVQVQANANGGSAEGNLSVVPPAAPASLMYSATPLLGGDKTTGKVIVASAVTAPTIVTLTVVSGANAIASIPATVTIPAGATSATFSITTASVSTSTAVQISASTNTGTATATLTVQPPVPSSVVFLTNPVNGGSTTSVRIVMQQAVIAPTTVTLLAVSGSDAVKSIPASVTVSAGHNTVVFSMSTYFVTTQTSVQVTATANGGSATGTETVAVP
jgi:hypothetical protein